MADHDEHQKPFYSDIDPQVDLIAWGNHVGTEARKSFHHWLQSGFLDKFLSGRNILDIGYKGYGEDAHPILPWAIGIDLDYPGYDGRRLPFEDGSQDAVFSSHTLEHIPDYRNALSDWFRVIRPNGHLITIVPHQFLYERRANLPSLWNADHRRFYTSASLLREVEEAIEPVFFRVRYLKDNDWQFDYTIPPGKHAAGCYEIILVLQKIARPSYFDEIFRGEELPDIAEILQRDDRSFVEGLYRLLLKRVPDPSGWDAYTDLLRQGMKRLKLISTIAKSEEARSRGLQIPEEVRSLIDDGNRS